MLKKIFGALVVTALILLLGSFGYEYSTGGLPLVRPPDPVEEGRSVRIVVSQRPAGLPVRAMRRLPELSHLQLDIRTVEEPSDKWMLLAAGQVDIVVASLDEFALAVPRFDPGVMVFPVALSVGSDAILKAPEADGGMRLTYPEGTAAQFLALIYADPQRGDRQVGASSPEEAVEWFREGEAEAIAVWEPWASQLIAEGAEPVAQTSPGSPISEVWVVSHQALDGRSAPRVQKEDIEAVAQAWFNLVDHLRQRPSLTYRAIAEENSMQADQLQAALQGLRFLTVTEAQDVESAKEELVRRLQAYLSVWSLAGAPNTGTSEEQQRFQKAVDFRLLMVLSIPEGQAMLGGGEPEPEPTAAPELPFIPVIGEPPIPADTPTPLEAPQESPTPGETPPPEPIESSSEGSMFGGDLGRTGRYTTGALQEFSQEAFKFKAGGEIRTAPAIVDDLMVFGCDDGKVYGADANTGKRRWAFPTGEAVQSSPAVAGGVVFVGSNDARLYALTADKGEKKWTFPTNGEVASSPAVVGGVVYVGSQDHKMYAVEAETGKELWSFDSGGPVDSSPAVLDGKVFFGSHDKKVYALDAATGSKIWERSTGNIVLASPCVVAETVYIGSRDGKMYALSVEDGAIRWTFETEGDIVSSASYADGQICFGSKDTRIYSVDAETGKERWNFPSRGPITTSGAIAGDVFYIGGEDDRLYALGLDTGDLKWRHKVGNWVYSPVPRDGRVYFGTAEKLLYSLK